MRGVEERLVCSKNPSRVRDLDEGGTELNDISPTVGSGKPIIYEKQAEKMRELPDLRLNQV